MTPENLRSQIAAIKAEQKRLLQSSEAATYKKLIKLLVRLDPTGLLGVPSHEDEETNAFALYVFLGNCSSETECLGVIHQQFCHWFSEDVAGPVSRYQFLAKEVWALWNESE
jgi:hypothetical protein